jgi:signal transduction histidine kinase
VAGAMLVVVLGCVGSFFAARVVAHDDKQKSQRALAATSADVTARLRLAIQHEEDLVVSTSALIVSNPRISIAKFNEWVRADRVVERYPEILGLGRIVVVPRSQLANYGARALKDPAGPLAPGGSFRVIPSGKRPFYCFIDLAGRSPGLMVTPAVLDVCAATGNKIVPAHDPAQGNYEPVQLETVRALGVQTPLYRGGLVPRTAAARRAAFIGWIGIALTPKVVMHAALEAHPDTALTLRYDHRGSPAVAFRAGKAPPGAESLTVDLHNGWTVRATAVVAGGAVFSNWHALSVLLGGMALSVLVGLLGVVLATGRTRALRLASEQTIELRDQAAELHVTVDELEAAQGVKDEFVALVSHELRTPLTSIRGYAELLRDEGLTDEQREYVDVIDRNSARLGGLVEDLLLMTQIQSGGVPLELGEVVLNDLIARSGEAARPFAASKEIELDIDIEPSIATEGDPVRLGQMLDNLVSNAIKYTPSGGAVSITMTRAGETATIAVRDSGIGIPEEEHAQMFSRFFRASNARVSGIDGTGLGLAITRGIVEAHGGTIGFDSVVGAGTTFSITLPHAHGCGLESAA